VIFSAWRKTGEVDLEAVEMAVRGAMHRAGAAALARLLSLDHEHPARVACSCGGQARWHSLRRKRLLTAVGPVEFQRAYYVCPDCHRGQSPRDRELEVEGVECSPGVQRMLALVGSESSFEQGREQLALLAGLAVTAKCVERHAEAIGADVEAHQQEQIHRAKQLELPAVGAARIPILYIEMDGTGVPMVQAEPKVAPANWKASQRTHARPNWVVCSRKPPLMKKAGPCVIRTPLAMSRPLKAPSSSACVCTPKLGAGAGAGRKRRSCWATVRYGSGIWPRNIFQARFRSWICITPASISGSFLPSFLLPKKKFASVGWPVVLRS